MQLAFQGICLERRPALRQRAREKFERALARIQDRAVRLVVGLSDVNGPRGGVDKRCVARAWLTCGASVVTEGIARSSERALDRAARRLRASLNSRFERQWKNRRRWRRGHAQHRAPAAAEGPTRTAESYVPEAILLDQDARQPEHPRETGE
jgi:hypothetical protein